MLVVCASSPIRCAVRDDLTKRLRKTPRQEFPQRPAQTLSTAGVMISLVCFQDQVAFAAESAAVFAGPIATALRPALFVGQSLMLLRIVLSWFPEIKETELPWLVAYLPTEPILKATRRIVPPAFGVDISPVVWFAILSFIGEVLIGPQGILNIIQRSST